MKKLVFGKLDRRLLLIFLSGLSSRKNWNFLRVKRIEMVLSEGHYFFFFHWKRVVRVHPNYQRPLSFTQARIWARQWLPTHHIVNVIGIRKVRAYSGAVWAALKVSRRKKSIPYIHVYTRVFFSLSCSSRRSQVISPTWPRKSSTLRELLFLAIIISNNIPVLDTEKKPPS